jgi:RNA recognition motif-containing protein
MTDPITLFVGSLPLWTTARDIEGWLQAVDLEFISARVLHDNESGQSKRCGFIDCRTTEDADKIIDRYDGAPIDDKVLRVMRARPKPEMAAGN